MPIEDVAWAIKDVTERAPDLRLRLNYYEGKHRLAFATEKYENAFGDLFEEFADNMCDDVVDEPVTRTKILSWSAEDETTAQAATDWWETVKGPARLKTLARNAYRDGDGIAMVWPDPQNVPRLYVQDTDQWAIRYDPDEPDKIKVAAKVWKAGKRWRCTLYYDGVIERWASKGSSPTGGIPKAEAFGHYNEIPADVDDDEQPQPWRTTHDWGMPVFHLPTDEVGRYGRSVLTDVIPLQDALNKAITDMLVNMEATAYPQRWATGIQVERNPDGSERNPFKDNARSVYWTANDKASFGAFPVGSSQDFLSVQDGLRMEIGRKGYLPPASVVLKTQGDATATGLLVGEGRQIKRVKDNADAWEPELRALMALALRMAGTETDAAAIQIEWDNPATRDEKGLWEVLTMKDALGVSKHQILVEGGYDEETIAAMEEDSRIAREAAGLPGVGDVRATGGLGAPLAGQNALGGTRMLPPPPQSPQGAPSLAQTA
jgi:Phage portal protein, SPP1 Gp6-like